MERLSLCVGGLALIAALLAGFWLDSMISLDQTTLFVVFQVLSIAGAITAMLWWMPRACSPWQRALLVIAVLLAWRVSYFPVMVFGGWIATLVEQLVLPYETLPIAIYPIFLLAVLIMHTAAAMAAGAIATWRWRYFLPVSISAFIVAALVSFTSPIDYRLLPDSELSLSQPLPPGHLPKTNPYLAALDSQQYSLPQRTLVYAAGSIYNLIPHSPWSATVKGTLEELFRAQPQASTTERVREHYYAYHRAHHLIGCRHSCP